MSKYPFALVPGHFERIVKARDQAERLLLDLAQGIRDQNIRQESEAMDLYKKLAAVHGSPKFWHAPKIRFGKNTLLNFRKASDPDVRLENEDVFFVDIGPVFDDFEADIGDSFVLGDNPEHRRLASASRIIFEELKAHWKKNRASGRALYDFADTVAEKLDVVMMRQDGPGHIVTDFPHKLKSLGELQKYEQEVLPGIWILEVQIRHPSLERGAFFEDLLWEE